MPGRNRLEFLLGQGGEHELRQTALEGEGFSLIEGEADVVRVLGAEWSELVFEPMAEAREDVPWIAVGATAGFHMHEV
jgi:hypothetical protein